MGTHRRGEGAWQWGCLSVPCSCQISLLSGDSGGAFWRPMKSEDSPDCLGFTAHLLPFSPFLLDQPLDLLS